MLRIEIEIIQADLGFVSALLKEIDGLIDRYPVNPRIKARAPFKRFQGLESFNKSFLGKVIGILVIGSHVVNSGVYALLITPHELVISGQIALPGTFHQQL